MIGCNQRPNQTMMYYFRAKYLKKTRLKLKYHKIPSKELREKKNFVPLDKTKTVPALASAASKYS